jgi:hypothetical protein
VEVPVSKSSDTLKPCPVPTQTATTPPKSNSPATPSRKTLKKRMMSRRSTSRMMKGRRLARRATIFRIANYDAACAAAAISSRRHRCQRRIESRARGWTLAACHRSRTERDLRRSSIGRAPIYLVSFELRWVSCRKQWPNHLGTMSQPKVQASTEHLPVRIRDSEM